MERIIFYKIVQILLCNSYLQWVKVIFFFYDSIVLPWIKKKKYIPKKRKKVIITFPLSLGDVVIFLNSIPQITTIFDREKYEVTIACQSEYVELFNDYFEHVMDLDYRKSCINMIYRRKMLQMIRGEYYDIAIDPIGCEECSPNVFFMNAVCAKEKIGAMSVTDKKIQCPKWIREKVYTEIIFNPSKNLHKVKYYSYFWNEYSGMDLKAQLIQLPYQYKKMKERYFIVFPSASTKIKMWAVENYVEIAKKIYKQTGYLLVLCGTGSDKDTVNEFILELKGEIPYVNMVGRTSIKEFIGLIGNAELVVTNDTSTYHIAVMQRRRTCVVTGGYVYDSFINYDWIEDEYYKPEIVYKAKECMNCNNQCIYRVKDTYPCVAENTISDVWEAIQRLPDINASEVIEKI